MLNTTSIDYNKTLEPLKKLSYLLMLFCLCTLAACVGDETALNDFDLFGRLKSGNGTWEIVSIQTKDNSMAESQASTEQIDNSFIHFYMRTIEVSSSIIDAPTAVFYVNDEPTSIFFCEAEKERVLLQSQSEVFGGQVWTVTEDKRNEQVWTFVSGTETIIMTLKRCNCDIPAASAVEFGG